MDVKDLDRLGIGAALSQSAQSLFGRVKIGAVIVGKRGEFLGYGFNQRRTHPRQYLANLRVGKQIERPCLHAEIAAILDAEQYYDQWAVRTEMHTLYVARLDRNGAWANCKPCAACHNEIVRVGIKRVVYTSQTGAKEYFV